MTPHEATATITSAALTGVSTAAMQAVTPGGDVLPLLTPLLSAAIGGGVAYGVMKATLAALHIEIRDLKERVNKVHDKADLTSQRVAYLAGKVQVPLPALRDDD
jgi:hypothetical protein